MPRVLIAATQGLIVTTATAMVCVALACRQAPSVPVGHVTVRDSAGVTIVENPISSSAPRCLLDTIPSVSIGVAEGSPAGQLFRVSGAARFSDGKIVIANARTTEIRLFGPDGWFLLASDRKEMDPACSIG